MPHINPFKWLTDWVGRSIAVGVLLFGLAAAVVIYLYQDLGKYERTLPPASEWNAARVSAGFNQFMSVIQQHEEIVDVFDTLDGTVSVSILRRTASSARSLENRTDKEFNLLLAELVKAVEFNRLYGAYVYEELPDYPDAHLNLLNELRALKPTILGLKILGGRNATIYHDINVRLRPYTRNLGMLAAVSGERRQQQEDERTDRIQKLSRYVLIITGLLVLVGVGILILFIARDRTKRKIEELEHEISLEVMEQLTVGLAFYDADRKLIRTNQAYRDLYQYPVELNRVGTPLTTKMRYDVEQGMYGVVDDVEEFLQARLTSRTAMEDYSVDQVLPDGRIIEVLGRGLSTEGFWGIYTDVNEKRRAEQQQEERIEKLENQMGLETLEHVDVGISIIDADLNVVHNNSVVSKMYGFPESITQPGQPFKGILLTLAEWGVYGEGAPEGLVSDLIKSFSGSWTEWRDDLELPNGQVIDVRTHKLSGGGLAYIHTDVTKERQAQRLVELTDRITGLPTFDHLEQQLVGILEDAIQRSSEFYGIRIKVTAFRPLTRFIA